MMLKAEIAAYRSEFEMGHATSNKSLLVTATLWLAFFGLAVVVGLLN